MFYRFVTILNNETVQVLQHACLMGWFFVLFFFSKKRKSNFLYMREQQAYTEAENLKLVLQVVTSMGIVRVLFAAFYISKTFMKSLQIVQWYYFPLFLKEVRDYTEMEAWLIKNRYNQKSTCLSCFVQVYEKSMIDFLLPVCDYNFLSLTVLFF